MSEIEMQSFWNKITIDPQFPNQIEVREELSEGYQTYIIAPVNV